jgi:hypothetical protein
MFSVCCLVYLDLGDVLFEGSRKGYAIAQAVSRWTLTADARVCAHVSPRGICGGQSGIGSGFLSELFCFPLSVPFHRGSPHSYHLVDED